MPPSPTVRAFMALGRAKAAKKNRDQHRAVLALLIAWFGSKAAVGATQFPPELVAALTNAGFDRQAVLMFGAKLLARPLSGRTRHGAPAPAEGMSTTRLVATEEPEYRAQYTVAALERLTEAKADGRFDQALNVEENYLDAHVAAGRRRRQAARKLDEFGDRLMRWHTTMDKNTTPDCAALNGRIFHASSPPGLPGAMHPRCRCTAEPWGGMHVPVT